MKPRSAFFTAALAAIGFAFATVQASALPASKSSPPHRFHNHNKKEKKVETEKRECKEATCTNSEQKKAGAGGEKERKRMRPYFERKRGLPAVSRRR